MKGRLVVVRSKQEVIPFSRLVNSRQSTARTTERTSVHDSSFHGGFVFGGERFRLIQKHRSTKSRPGRREAKRGRKRSRKFFISRSRLPTAKYKRNFTSSPRVFALWKGAQNSGSSPKRQRKPGEVVGSWRSLKQGVTKKGREKWRHRERSFSGRSPPFFD